MFGFKSPFKKLFAAADGTAAHAILYCDIGHHESLLYSRLTQAVVIVPTIDARLLLRYASGAESGVANEAAEFRGFAKSRIEKIMRDGYDNRLILSPADMREYITKCFGKATVEATEVTTVAIPTRARAVSLQQAVLSVAHNRQRHNRTYEIAIMDDSESPTITTDVRDRLRCISREHAVQIAYGDMLDRIRFASELKRESDVPPNIIDFAILNPLRYAITTGACRNALLLQTAGTIFVTVDDDTRWHLHRHINATERVTLDSRNDPTEIWFGSTCNVNGLLATTSDDFAQLNERFLGRQVGAVLRHQNEKESWTNRGLNEGFLRALEFGRCPIVLTMAGYLGDSGMGSHIGFLLRSGQTHRRLIDSTTTYEQALRDRNILRTVTEPVITTGTHCMTMGCGVDNRNLVPPFLPILRNQDMLFGLMVRMTIPGSVSAFLPVVIRHEPERRPPFASVHEMVQKSAIMGTADIIASLLSGLEMPPEISEASDRLVWMGMFLTGLADRELGQFETAVRERVLRVMGRELRRIDECLEINHDGPQYWRADLEKVRERLRDRISDSHVVIPGDIASGGSRSDLLQRVRNVVRNYGQLLQYWPRIVASARTLKASGVQIASGVM